MTPDDDPHTRWVRMTRQQRDWLHKINLDPADALVAEFDAAAASTPDEAEYMGPFGKYDVPDRRMDDVPAHRIATRLPNVGLCPVCGRDECPGWAENTDEEPDPNADCLLESRLGKLLAIAVPAAGSPDHTTHHDTLAEALRAVKRADQAGDYDARQRAILEAIGLAARSGISVGFRIDPAEPEWPVVYFELPTGQVSWHMPQHPSEWDGHTTASKYRRLDSFAALAAANPTTEEANAVRRIVHGGIPDIREVPAAPAAATTTNQHTEET